MHSEDSRLTTAIDACRKGFIAIGVFSLFINLLMLTAPLYMLQLFDRVLTSRSTDTLVVLMLIAAVALLVMTILEIVRGAMLVRLGTWLEWRLAGDVLNADVFANLRDSAQRSDQGLRDLSTVRGVLSGPALFPILDAPWTPIFLGVMFLLHPTLGWISTAGAIILFGLAIFNERWTRANQSDMSGAFMSAQNKADDAVRNADAIGAMGMMPNFMSSWYPDYSKALDNQQAVGQGGIAIAAASKLVRLFLQIGLLSSGAWLVLNNELGPGAMIAGSILMSRALAPVEQAMGSWKTVLAARAAYARLRDLLGGLPQNPDAMPIPNPKGDITVENIGYRYPEGEKPALAKINFALADGETLGIMGPTASGKSTLSRLIAGNLKPTTGHVRLSGVDVSDWQSNDRGQYVGYLPQTVQLFEGTVHHNIARLTKGAPEDVVAAAEMAGVHDMILRLPNGYDTEIGPAGSRLSGGQRQRIALARAIYGNPKLVVLDEPNAALDGEGENALVDAIARLKAAGKTVVVIAQRWGILRDVDKLLVLNEGVIEHYGSRDEVFAQLRVQRVQVNRSHLEAVENE